MMLLALTKHLRHPESEQVDKRSVSLFFWNYDLQISKSGKEEFRGRGKKENTIGFENKLQESQIK